MTSAAEAARRQERQDELFAAAQESFPDKHLIELPAGGFAAIPADTEIITADDLDGLIRNSRLSSFPTFGRPLIGRLPDTSRSSAVRPGLPAIDDDPSSLEATIALFESGIGYNQRLVVVAADVITPQHRSIALLVAGCYFTEMLDGTNIIVP